MVLILVWSQSGVLLYHIKTIQEHSNKWNNACLLVGLKQAMHQYKLIIACLLVGLKQAMHQFKLIIACLLVGLKQAMHQFKLIILHPLICSTKVINKKCLWLFVVVADDDNEDNAVSNNF